MIESRKQMDNASLKFNNCSGMSSPLRSVQKDSGCTLVWTWFGMPCPPVCNMSDIFHCNIRYSDLFWYVIQKYDLENIN